MKNIHTHTHNRIFDLALPQFLTVRNKYPQLCSCYRLRLLRGVPNPRYWCKIGVHFFFCFLSKVCSLGVYPAHQQADGHGRPGADVEQDGSPVQPLVSFPLRVAQSLFHLLDLLRGAGDPLLAVPLSDVPRVLCHAVAVRHPCRQVVFRGGLELQTGSWLTVGHAVVEVRPGWSWWWGWRWW